MVRCLPVHGNELHLRMKFRSVPDLRSRLPPLAAAVRRTGPSPVAAHLPACNKGTRLNLGAPCLALHCPAFTPVLPMYLPSLQRLRIMEFTLDHEAPYFSNMRRRTSRKVGLATRARARARPKSHPGL